MPARSRKQLKYIWTMRKKYKTKKNAPKSMKWVFNKEWTEDIKPSTLPVRVKDFKSYVSENYNF